MDIVVTIPKSRLAEVTKEEERVAAGVQKGEKWRYYWNLPTVPKKAEVGDRCYFVWEGAIRAWHEITDIEWGWEDEPPMLWMKPEIHKLRKPLSMKGFRGFRYFDRKEVAA